MPLIAGTSMMISLLINGISFVGPSVQISLITTNVHASSLLQTETYEIMIHERRYERLLADMNVKM